MKTVLLTVVLVLVAGLLLAVRVLTVKGAGSHHTTIVRRHPGTTAGRTDQAARRNRHSEKS